MFKPRNELEEKNFNPLRESMIDVLTIGLPVVGTHLLLEWWNTKREQDLMEQKVKEGMSADNARIYVSVKKGPIALIEGIGGAAMVGGAVALDRYTNIPEWARNGMMGIGIGGITNAATLGIEMANTKKLFPAQYEAMKVLVREEKKK